MTRYGQDQYGDMQPSPEGSFVRFADVEAERKLFDRLVMSEHKAKKQRDELAIALSLIRGARYDDATVRAVADAALAMAGRGE